MHHKGAIVEYFKHPIYIRKMSLSPDKTYDIVIVGSGMGGLACGYILAKNGYSVCILEKNPQIGGNLQIFSRKKTIFDTGVHYLGGLDEGQNLYQFFKYFDLIGKLKMIRMEDDGFDRIQFHDDDKVYKYAQGYDNFIKTLVADFPEEEKAIVTYCDKIREICKKFPMYNIEDSDEFYFDNDILYMNARDYINSLTDNPKLRRVLAGNIMLYAGEGERSPFYVHALVVNSYIESSWRIKDGGSHIAIQMTRSIRKMGGDLFKRADVISADYAADGTIKCVNLRDGRKVFGKNFISNVHPLVTTEIFGQDQFRKAYVNRLKDLESTISTFTLYIVTKPESYPYKNYNLYHCRDNDIWNMLDYNKSTWPNGLMLCTPASSKSDKWADGVTVMCYMDFKEMEPWLNTYNTVGEPEDRGQSYEDFKAEKTKQVLKYLEEIEPGFHNCIDEVYTSTPLTYRDYINNIDGSLYGIMKDHKNPLKTFINPKTKIPNLFLTGQNINLHGILGVSVSAFVTCFEFVNKSKLIQDVKNANKVEQIDNLEHNTKN